MGSLEEHFQHLNILCLPKLYSFSAGKFMHSYYNKLLPNHFDEYFIPLSSIHYHSTKLVTSKNLFLPRVNSSSGKCSLNLLAQKYGLQYQSILNFPPPLPLNGNVRNTSYIKKIPNYELQQHFICPTNNCEFQYSVTLFYFLCVFTFSYFLCAHSMLFGMKYTFCFFLFCFVFFCSSLISFCNFFTFYFIIF